MNTMREIKLKLSGSFFFILLIIVGCGHSGYEERNGKVYHKSIHGGSWSKEFTLVEDADPKTFETIETNLSIDLGKDQFHVFIDGYVIEGADPITFEQVKEYYWKDKNAVYLFGYGRIGSEIIEQADPNSFKVLNITDWASDKHNIYYMYSKLPDLNIDKFKPLSTDWGRDDKNYFYHDQRVDNLDYASAIILSAYYIKDDKHVFCRNEIVIDADPITFKPDGNGSFGHDKNYVFEWGKKKGPITDLYRKKYFDEN